MRNPGGRRLKLNEDQRSVIKQHLEMRTRTVAQLAAEYEVSRPTIYALLPESRKRVMTAPPNLKGKKFGRWLVRARALAPSASDRHVFWRCECVCGTVSSVRASYLIDGRSTQCGDCGRKRRTGEK